MNLYSRNKDFYLEKKKKMKVFLDLLQEKQ